MNSLGRHKLPLMGGGDWNDGMNKVGIKGKGESVWLGFFLYEIISDFVKMMKNIDKKFDTDEYEKFNEKLADGSFDCQQTMEYSQETMGEGVINVLDDELYPAYLPEGTTLVNKQAIDIEEGQRIIMTFSGDQDFTMIQEPVTYNDSVGVESVAGQPVMINGTIGALSENSITWVEGGVECFLVSETLDTEQLVSVAASVSNLAEK